MDIRLLQQLVQLMASHDLNTLDVRDGRRRVLLKRGQPVPQSVHLSQALGTLPPAAAPLTGAPTTAAASAGQSAAPAGSPDADAGLVPIKSPMVGTFYSASSPDAKPFVSVGSVVDEDTDVCIIEAMKVFNNIMAETRGTIARVLVSNSDTVEFGQTLFLVKPN